MFDYSIFPKRSILCVDMRSFYASVIAVTKGLDPLTCHLVVVGNTDQQGSIVLAASPAMKKDFRIKTGSRLFEIPNDPRIIIENPKMALFVRVSTEITKLFFRYVPPSAVHTYSVDESFLDVSGLEKIWGTPLQIAQYIQFDIFNDFGLPSTIGIGPNMLMAKLCLDLDAKKSPLGISCWTYEDIPSKLWPVSPLREMWGIGSRVEKTLNSMGIFSVEQLAHYDLRLLEKKFGIMGNQLYHHAWGVDLSEMGAPIIQGQISYGKSQILLRDYKEEGEIKAVLLEMCEEVAKRARNHHHAARTISLGMSYSKNEGGGGFHRSKTIDKATNVTMEIYQVCLYLFHAHYQGQIVRQISISITKLEKDQEVQLDLFDPYSWKKRKLGYIVDAVRNRYGSTALLRAVSYTDGGTSLLRANLLGGHKK